MLCASPASLAVRPSCGARRRPSPSFAAAAAAAAAAEGEGAESLGSRSSLADFIRFRSPGGDGGGRGAACELQTAVVRYQKRFPWSLMHPFLRVDLVSTVHIADKEGDPSTRISRASRLRTAYLSRYFDNLQKWLEDSDCVLYEMVASRAFLDDPEATTSSRSEGFNFIGFLQRQMARILSLDFQLDCLDYDGEKWQHADLDYETFKQLQRERGESFFTFARDMTLKSAKELVQPISIPDGLGFWRSKLYWASQALPMPLIGLLIISGVCLPMGNQAEEYPELEALTRLDLRSAVKIFLARQLSSEFTADTASIEENSVIVGERNMVATQELKTAIDSGYKRIAVLYGGGHMPDLARRLQEELNLVPSDVKWVTAWSIRNQELDISSLPFLKTMADVSGWPLNRYQTLALLIFSSVLAVDLWFWELFFGTAVNSASWVASQLNQFTGPF